MVKTPRKTSKCNKDFEYVTLTVISVSSKFRFFFFFTLLFFFSKSKTSKVILAFEDRIK